MKSEPILFFAAVEDERDRICPHGKLLPMPQTREQREAEDHEHVRKFFWACLGVMSLVFVAAAWFVRGCR